jgi:predicted metal-dependent phosphotriesterase family hydrolase
MSVRGPVPADQLGRTLPHEHLLIELSRVVEYGRQLGIPRPVNEALTLAIETVEQTSDRRAHLMQNREATGT